MSAPIAVKALVTLPSKPLCSILLFAVVPVGMWAKASISPVSELAREAGGSADGRQRRSSTYPLAFVVNLARRVVAEALVLALFVIEAEPGANAGLCLGDTGIGMQVDLLILQTAPQPLDEDVVHTATFAIHADGDTAPIEHCDDLGVGELAALVGVEDLRPAVSGQRFLQGLDAEVRAERVRQSPRQHRTTVPLHDRDQIQETLSHRDIEPAPAKAGVMSEHQTWLARSIDNPPSR